MNRVRISTEQFIGKIKSSPEWTLHHNTLLGELELWTKETDKDWEVFLGPDPLSIDGPIYTAFVIEVDFLTQIPAVVRSPY